MIPSIRCATAARGSSGLIAPAYFSSSSRNGRKLPRSRSAIRRIAFRLIPHPSDLGSLRRLRIPLPLAHARDRDAREHARLLKWVGVHKSLGLGTAVHMDDQQAADVPLAIVAQRRARDDQYFILAVKIIDVGLQALFTHGGEVGRGDARDGPKHKDFLSSLNGDEIGVTIEGDGIVMMYKPPSVKFFSIHSTRHGCPPV